MAAQSPSQHSSALRDLRHAVETMDCLSQEGFSQIAAIARCAQAYLNTHNEICHLDQLNWALSAISSKADDILNCINVQAEDVGCHYQGHAAGLLPVVHAVSLNG